MVERHDKVFRTAGENDVGKIRLRARWLVVLGLVLGSMACGQEPTGEMPVKAVASDGSNQNAVHLDVYKSPTCGCCSLWMDHMTHHGFAVSGHHPDSLGLLKKNLGVSPQYSSCHTAVSSEGFVFEGHVPARYIKAFLANPVQGALGLTVPAMPVGSPGMEYEGQFNPYDVILMNKNGSTEVYARVVAYQDQF